MVISFIFDQIQHSNIVFTAFIRNSIFQTLIFQTYELNPFSDMNIAENQR